MGELINFCLNDGDKEFIRITRNGAIWTNDKKYRLSCNKTSLKFAVNYLLDNCYFILVSTCFCQVIGISVGSQPTPSYDKLVFLLF